MTIISKLEKRKFFYALRKSFKTPKRFLNLQNSQKLSRYKRHF